MSDGPRIFPRMGRIALARRTMQERLESLSSILQGDGELRHQARRDAAYFLRRLSETPKALRAMDSQGGRPSDWRRHTDIAIDYLIHKKLLGNGKAALAKGRIAFDWSTSEKTVENCWTAYQLPAIHELDDLIDSHLVDHDDGVANHYQDKGKLMRDISRDLHDINEIGPPSDPIFLEN